MPADERVLTVDWAGFAAMAPELERDVTPLLTRTAHHVLATLRADGSPLVSGTEVQFGMTPDRGVRRRSGRRHERLIPHPVP